MLEQVSDLGGDMPEQEGSFMSSVIKKRYKNCVKVMTLPMTFDLLLTEHVEQNTP